MKSSLSAILFETAARFADHPALIAPEETLCYQALATRIRMAAGTLHGHGVAPGDRVGLLAYNTVDFVVAYFAALTLGAVVIPLNTRLTAAELDVILHDADAHCLVTTNDFETVARQLDFAQTHPVFFSLAGDGLWEGASNAAPGDLATLIYTSGTTGRPKGVMLSHGNILADARANAHAIAATPDDVFVTVSPLFHVFGQTNIMVTAVLSGACVVLVKKFSPRAILEAIETHRVTFLAAVPTMYQMMLTHLRGERQFDLRSLRVCHSGAAPMAETIFHAVESAFGAPVQEGYGLSEASSIVTSNPLVGLRKPGTVGLPLVGVSLEVRDENDCPVAAGEIGEVHVRGDIVMQGYWKRPDETALVLKPGGWLRTRDMGYLDTDGYLHIVDRMDDLINIGGVKVYPREIEEVLYRHPAVDAVAVTGQPSTLYHEAIQAFVVLKPDADCTREALQEFCKPYLAEYKIPKHFSFVSEIPQGATGKILRRVLRTRDALEPQQPAQ